MRYTPTPIGTERTLTKFAWYPRKIGNTWILFEKYQVIQKLELVHGQVWAGGTMFPLFIPHSEWVTHTWLLPPESK